MKVQHANKRLQRARCVRAPLLPVDLYRIQTSRYSSAVKHTIYVYLGSLY